MKLRGEIEPPIVGADTSVIFGLGAAGRLHPLQRHILLLPQPGRFAALAERQVHHSDLITQLRVQRDGSAAAPDNIYHMGADRK